MLTREVLSRLLHSRASLASACVARRGVLSGSVQHRCARQPAAVPFNSLATSASSSPHSTTPSAASSTTSSTSTAASTSTSNPSPPASPSSSSRPFRILGLQQVAIGSTSLPALSSLWCATLGLPYQSSYTSTAENVTEHILSLGPHPRSPFAVELDLMQPLDATGSPAPHRPPLNHIGLWVDDLRAAVAWMEGSEGRIRMAPGGVRKGASGHDICFIHPKGDETRGLRGGEGVLIELVQAPQHVIEAFEAEARRVSGGGDGGGGGHK